MVSAILERDPVIYIDHRWLHEDTGEVPGGLYRVPIGKANVLRSGTDLTIVAVGPMVQESLKAADALKGEGKSIELIDLRTIRPLDFDTVLASVRKTGRLLMCDSDWPHCGVASAVISHVTQNAFGSLKSAPHAVTWPDHPAPACYTLDTAYYPMSKDIVEAVERMFAEKTGATTQETVKQFHGPF